MENLLKEEYTYTNSAGTNTTTTQISGMKTTVNGVVENDFQYTYDGIGNPIKYYNGKSYSFTWTEGRRLAAVGSSWKYMYDADGLRIKKQHASNLSTEYLIADGVTIGERYCNPNGGLIRALRYIFDENGSVCGYMSSKDEENWTEYYFIRNLQGDVLKVIRESDGAIVAEYTYDSWGNILSQTGECASENPFRYRGYYYDSETGFYYLGSRYYDAKLGRFINADGYASTGQGVIGLNMYVYCGNNPINRVDSTGQFWNEAWEFIKTAVSEIGNTIQQLAPAYAGCGGAALADGPLPVGDVIAISGIAALTVVGVSYGIYQTVQKQISKSKTDEKTVAITEPLPSSTVIYRYGGTNPGNFVPSKNDVMFNAGLSFSTIPKEGAAVTTIEALNATGVVYAVKDGPTHVSVYPVGGTIAQWRSLGASSIWTQAIKSVVIKWDGEN